MSRHIIRTSEQHHRVLQKGRNSHRNPSRSRHSLEVLQGLCLSALDLLACLYLLMVIAVVPLYQKQSYAQIGTDKRNFFNGYLQLHSKVLLLLVAVWLFCSLVRFFITHKKDLSLQLIRDKLLVIRKQFTLTDRFVAAYFLVVLLSVLCTKYKDLALLGASGWTMGTLMQLSLAAGYFLISRAWKKRLWIILLMLPVSFLLYFLGYCNRFGVWPIAMEYSENPQFLSLAGNINWYCGYLVTILFGGVSLFWSDAFAETWQRHLLRLYLFAGFGALITNGSSSGVLTLVVSFFILFLMSAADCHRMERFFETVLLFGLACLVTLGIRILFPEAITYQETTNNLFTHTLLPVVLTFAALTAWLLIHKLVSLQKYPVRFFRLLTRITGILAITVTVLFLILLILNTHKPGSIGPLSSYSFFTFSEEWGSRRGATWMAGWMAFTEQPFLRKLIGVGPDCMPGYLYQDSSAALLTMLQTLWPTTTLSNAHNEWLTVLVNLGLLGLISYAGLILSSIRSFLKTGCTRAVPYAPLIGACGLAILAYTLHNVVSFQQVLNEPAMFVILGIGAAYSRNSE